MFTDRLRRASYGWFVVQGLLAAVAPKRSIAFKLKLWGLALDDVDAAEPKPWYVRSVRAAGIGMIATGVSGFVFERRAASAAEQEAADSSPAEPVAVAVDSDETA